MMICAKYCLVISIPFILINSIHAESQSNNTMWSLLPSFVSKIYGDCEHKDYELVDCLKIKLISLLDRIRRSDVIELDDSVTLVRESKQIENGRALTEQDIENSLTGTKEKGSYLTHMLLERASKFLNSHVLKINFPKFDMSSLTKDLSEGRGKMKKTMGMFMMAAMMKAMMMIPMSIGTLFILAGKALIISKIALVLSLLITLKKLLAKPTEHVVHESHGWNPSGGTGGWDRRSYRLPENMAGTVNTNAAAAQAAANANSNNNNYNNNYSNTAGTYGNYNTVGYAGQQSYNSQAAQNLAYNSYINH